MKLTYCIVVLSIILLSVFSCKEKFSTGKEIQIEKPVFKESHGIGRLNDEPWKSNTPTTEGISKMMTIVDEFILSDDFEAYKSLKKSLEDEIITIFSKCTMKGEAHDELHHYLLPLHEMLTDLESENMSVCKKQVKAIKYQLAIYPIYFK